MRPLAGVRVDGGQNQCHRLPQHRPVCPQDGCTEGDMTHLARWSTRSEAKPKSQMWMPQLCDFFVMSIDVMIPNILPPK